MPWELRVAEEQVAQAIAGATSWREVLETLGYAYHGKSIATIRKWAHRWGISTEHLTDLRAGRRAQRYTDEQLMDSVAASDSWTEALRRLGLCPSGGNWRTLKRRAAELGISTEHFDPYAASRRRRGGRIALVDVLVEGSTYSRTSLKRRLYAEGLKERRCELCGQDEHWNGRKIGLILDHINGVRDDHRIENLRIVCPNCAAGLDTHCGRKNRLETPARSCVRCKQVFVPRSPSQRYCSRYCGSRWDRRAIAKPRARRVPRPPRDQLIREVKELGYLAVGRKYGVSDNAIRKWLRQYERERAAAGEGDIEAVRIPTRTWPNRIRGRTV